MKPILRTVLTRVICYLSILYTFPLVCVKDLFYPKKTQIPAVGHSDSDLANFMIAVAGKIYSDFRLVFTQGNIRIRLQPIRQTRK